MDPGIAMTIWVIYGPNTLDHPGLFVVRAQDVIRGLDFPVSRAEYTLHATLEEARKAVPEFETYPRDGVNWASVLTRIERHPDDDPCIVETWL
jgi:hypothetical protein